MLEVLDPIFLPVWLMRRRLYQIYIKVNVSLCVGALLKLSSNEERLDSKFH